MSEIRIIKNYSDTSDCRWIRLGTNGTSNEGECQLYKGTCLEWGPPQTNFTMYSIMPCLVGKYFKNNKFEFLKFLHKYIVVI